MISVIVPAYNAEQKISRCIDSLLAQTETDFEVLVVDDGSEDGTAAVVQTFAERDVRVKLIRQQNAGVSAARNRGIDSARGDLLCFVDSDDWVSPSYLFELREQYAPGILPVIDVLRSDCTGSVLEPVENRYVLSESWSDDYLSGALGRGILFSVWNKLFSAQVVQQACLRFQEELAVGEDLLFVLKYLCFCREIRFSPKAVYHYEVMAGSAVVSRRDYTPDYEKLLAALRRFSSERQEISETALAVWAFDAVVQIAANPFVCDLPYSLFRRWWSTFTNTRIFQTAFQAPITVSAKRAPFYRLAAAGSTRGVYLALRAFRVLQERGTSREE